MKNVLITNDDVAIIADFGTSVDLSDKNKPTAKEIGGSRHCMAPEVVLEESYDCKADVFSLGIIVLGLLVGRDVSLDIEYAPSSGADDETILKHYKSLRQKDLDEVCKDPTSPACKFVIAALNEDPKVRPSAEELLSYKFITDIKS